MKKLVGNFFNKALTVIGNTIVSIWIIWFIFSAVLIISIFLFPSLLDNLPCIDLGEDEREFYTDTWPPQ